jgi:hypothetical protein
VSGEDPLEPILDFLLQREVGEKIDHTCDRSVMFVNLEASVMFVNLEASVVFVNLEAGVIFVILEARARGVPM